MNALTLLKQDHQNVEALFKRFEQLGEGGEPAEKKQIVDKVIEHLSVHAVIEEQLFYPAVREQAPDATFTVLEGLEEHHVVKWVLAELEKMAPTDERYEAKFTVLMENVRHHVEEEETDIFPKLREAMTVEQLNTLGESMEKAKETAPTRPHPRTPDTPPLNIILGAPMAVLDRAIKTGRETVEKVLNR
ncbi:MAG TPA: hemerythrin domain-containing protein [Acidimicrobiales bacterium]|nr:hemerythrin domain-containing protein [Acidimicrobiales bacterium]